MTDTKQQKEALVTGILLRLSKSYPVYSKVCQASKKGLEKFSLQQLNALYAMVLTSTKS